jgi:hypothetical protein
VFVDRFDVTRRALADALRHGFDKKDIQECTSGLTEKHFYKTMPSVARPGVSKTSPGAMQDVYRRRFKGILWYIKLTMADSRKDKGLWVVVVSFKEKN